MNSTVDIPGMQQMDAETFDVIVIGAGLSGVGTAVRLQRDCPDRDFILLERREAIGGTWDLFRYPGIRSDSDMHTLGYDFKPWEAEKTIADGPSILSYVNETADEYRIRERIRFGQKLIAADWSSERSQWQLTVETPDGVRRYRCGFLMMCAGYYSYDQGYEPEFEGKASFSGEWVHPQFWPENLGGDCHDAGTQHGEASKKGNDVAALSHLCDLEAIYGCTCQQIAPVFATQACLRHCSLAEHPMAAVGIQAQPRRAGSTQTLAVEKGS
jgi:hypothetical protein